MSHTRFAFLGFAALSLVVSSCATTGAGAPADAAPADPTADKLKAALAGAHRSPENAARDKYRHPAETLTFFGLRHDMTVVELWPGGGWYTEVLAPVLHGSGRLVVTSSDPNGDPENYGVKRAKEILALKEKFPDIMGKVEMAIIDPPDSLVFGPVGSADLVVSFRSMHGWLKSNQAEAIFAAVFSVLKPGGTFGIVEHRGTAEHKPESGYVPEAQAIALIEAAGFKLVEKSEINANPKDTKDYEKGVWTLPPSLALKDQDREKYIAIGESDRFTLKFTKP